MFGEAFINVFVFSVTFQMVVCSHVFFHEPSAVLLKPGGEPNPRSDFGFSMGYWKESLIVGSPRSNFIGEVYNCSLNGISDNELLCSVIDINVNGTIEYTLGTNPNQYFYLGGSIATTKDYAFTCAPLVTMIMNVTKEGEIEQKTDAVGSCFIYDGNTSTPYSGPGERYKMNVDTNTDRFEGGTGWTTLADEETDYLFIAKTSVTGDINYIPTSNPSAIVSSIITNDLGYSETKLHDFRDYWNVGNSITRGKFFSNEPVYAVSLQKKSSTTGTIVFIKIKSMIHNKNGKKFSVKSLDFVVNKGHKGRKKKPPFSIDDQVVGAMFGYSLASADLTQDGFSELLVGAPLQSEDANELEYGAMHIYLGGTDLFKINRKRTTIIGSTPRGRFGTTITASDVDGDNIPEVFVSAPYEDSGAVYVLSGFELQKLLASSVVIQVSKLKYSQRITDAGYTQLGFSLQVVPDLDGNGCNELAIGAPGSASVTLLKCLQTVKTAVFTELKGNNVRIQDSNFTVSACVNVTYLCGSEVSGIIDVNTEIIGNAVIKKPSFKVDLSKNKEEYCEDIIVEELQPGENGEYILTTKLKLEDNISSEINFNKSWAKLSIYSKTENQLIVQRQCSEGEDCTPHLTLSVDWHGQSEPVSSTGNETARNVYKVASSSSETVSITVRNIGMVATGTRCVVVNVVGAPVSKANQCRARAGYLECSTITLLRPNDENTFGVEVDTSSMLSSSDALIVTVKLYENCDRKVDIIEERQLRVEYAFDEAWKGVEVKGVCHVKHITDTELLASKNNDDNRKENKFKDDQEYLITNDGQVTWENVNVKIKVENRPFITMVTTAEYNCATDVNDLLTVNCTLTLPPKTTTKIMVSVEMDGQELDVALSSKQEINVTSHINMSTSTPEGLKHEQMSTTDIKLTHDMSFKNNPVLIAIVAIVVALIVLALVAYCLYKHGFFKRKQKKKLNVLRETVRRRSIRLASERSNRNNSQKSPSSADEDQIDIEVVEDSPFEDVPINPKDSLVLIESKAEVHEEDASNRKNK